ncbi:MAG: hypothetical protein J5685_13175 [Clostridiales bacterium]|nr:hypothetical protein [Clostridiales bacterium]
MSRDKILIGLTVILLIILGVVFWYDRNSAVLERTLPYQLTDDMKIVEMNKHGSLFARSSYEVKIRISHEDPESVMDMISEAYDFGGGFIGPEEYADFSNGLFDGFRIRPNPEPNTFIWVMSAKDEGYHEVTHIICSESATDAYLYIYYNR